MRSTNKGLKFYSQKILLFLVPLLLVFFIISCQRNIEPPPATGEFNTEAAKEWYYGTFKKSAEWASSPEHGKKLPDWKNGIYRKIGKMELVEFPLISSKKTISISSETSLSISDKRKIFEASLSRILFIKNADKSITVREVDYIPDWDFLQRKTFDVSESSLLKIENDFTGRVRIKNWKGNIISLKMLSDGKITQTGKIEIVDIRQVNNVRLNSSNTSECFTVETCDWMVECDVSTYPDGMEVWHCGAPILLGCTTERYCPDPCEDLSYEECACQVYGICGGGDGGGDENCGVPSNPSEILANGVSTSELIESINDPEVVGSTGDSARTWKGRWSFYTGTWLNYTWHYRSFDQGMHRKESGVWKWVSLSHTSHSQIGTSPFSTTCTMNDTTPIIDANKLSATMELEYEVKVCVECLGVSFGCPSENKTSSISFPAN